ncbi:putative G-protein coupled receptor No9 [Tachypleus tridentatus]|uniref:putative G-protein coupled receptor No9 n=1 Tax=Tachypleus tridentatus TaxID=6853 RepID=UPI003FCF0B6F
MNDSTARALSAETTAAYCLESISKEKLQNAQVIASFIVLSIINVIVIAGNLLVILSVFISAKLRTVTNFFIVSLAVSDFLVGLAVLPYSMTLEVLGVWVFGKTWCHIWLAVDVWLCTSSILNLCAISVDRYLAITRPVHYRSIMSPRRAKLVIAAVWVFAFIICFPPLVGWNDSRSVTDELVVQHVNSSLVEDQNKIISFVIEDNNNSLINASLQDNSHRVLPLLPETQSFLREISRANISTNQTTKTSLSRNTSLTCTVAICTLNSNKGYVIYSALGSFYIPMLVMLFFYWKIYAAASKTGRALQRGFKTTKLGKCKNEQGQEQFLTLRMHRGNTVSSIHVPEGSSQNHMVRAKSQRSHTARSSDESSRSARNSSCSSARILSTSFGSCKEPSYENNPRTLSGSQETDNGLTKEGRLYSTRMSKRNARWHARRFHAEAKAAKTVGIIVGGFICCWLPFFTIYLIGAFCDDCISSLLFSVFFWLGYCNSAINPFIYGLFSQDFRFAFKRILCRCLMKPEGISLLIRQIHIPLMVDDPRDITESS